MFDWETVLNGETFGFRCGLSKDVLLMVGKTVCRLQGKEMRKKKEAGAQRACRKGTIRRENKGKTLI